MATINPPWRFDPLQMPVNVSWGPKKYLLYIKFNWSDKEIQHFIDTIPQTPTIITSTVSISNDAPSGMLVYDNTIVESDGTINSYFRTMVFSVGELPPWEHPLTITFSISDQGDDTADYVSATYGSDSSGFGMTSLIGAVPNPGGTSITQRPIGGPWPAFNPVILYDAATCKVNTTNPLINVIQPINPNIPPVASSVLSFMSDEVLTLPSTDTSYYEAPPFPGSFPPDPSPVTTGGSYSTVGLLRGGELGLSLANFPVAGVSPEKTIPTVWPSSPSMFTVNYVQFKPLTLVNTYFFQPNPPPPYNLGVYTVSPDPSAGAGSPETGAYQSGGPPSPDNAYTGTFPAP
jgi:hypothetical protein